MKVYVTQNGERVPENLAKVLKSREGCISFTKHRQNPNTGEWSSMTVIDKVVKILEVEA